MPLKDILLEYSDGIASITINRPQRLNALGATTTIELCQACEEAINNQDIRVLIITGAGDAFCAGGDYKDTFEEGFTKSAQQWRERIRNGPNRLVTLLMGSEKPVIAAINGVAIGGGTTIALASDIRISSDRAKFGLAFSKIGLTPEFGCTYLLPRVVGLGKAIELAFTAEIIDAHEALRIGLVNRVVPHAELLSATRQLAMSLAEKPASSLGVMKSMFYRSMSMDLQSTLEMEAMALSAAFKTEEHQFAVNAFLQKRKK